MLKKKLLKFIWPLVYFLRGKLLPINIKKAEKILAKNYKKNNLSINTKDEIVLMFDENYSSGGLMDKIKGIISGKYIADQLGLDFYVYIKNRNFPIHNFLKSNQNIFRDENYEMVYNSKSKPIILYNYSPTKKTILDKFKSKKQYHLYCNMNFIPNFNFGIDQFQQNRIWSKYFNEMFSFSSSIVKLDQLSHIQKNNKIAIHLRFMNSLGDFKDIRNIELPNDEKEKLVQNCLQKITNTIKENIEIEKVLIFSDSAHFLNLVKPHFANTEFEQKIFINSENIKHSALNFDDKVFEKTILDFYQMSTCCKIFQIHYKNMHKSDFSKYASIVSNSEYYLIESENIL